MHSTTPHSLSIAFHTFSNHFSRSLEWVSRLNAGKEGVPQGMVKKETKWGFKHEQDFLNFICRKFYWFFPLSPPSSSASYLNFLLLYSLGRLWCWLIHSLYLHTNLCMPHSLTELFNQFSTHTREPVSYSILDWFLLSLAFFSVCPHSLQLINPFAALSSQTLKSIQSQL